MLDFYIISDSEAKPNAEKIDQLIYAGGLDYGVFDRLVRKGIIDSRFDFYTDFRWGNQLVKQIDSKTKVNCLDSDMKILKLMIDKAITSESGLIAFGD